MSVTRFERVDFADGELAKPQKTNDGYWKLEGRIARAGIQEYRRADGSVVRELRLPEDVKASAAGFALLPLTNGHPPGMVTPDNAKQYAVGAVGHADFSGGWVKAPMTVWSKDAIEAIRAGRAQLSAGYQCTLIDEAGEYEGQRYDCRQTEIIPNHLAIVDVARAGPNARLRLDSNSAVALDCISIVADQMEQKPMHKFAIDGLTIEVSDANAQAIVERAVKKQSDRADQAEKALVDAQKAVSENQAKLDMAEAKVKELTEAAEKHKAELADGVKALVALGAEVAKMGVDITKVDHSETAYKVAAVKKIRPSMNLDGKSADYINAAYDTARDDFAKQPSAADKARAGIGEQGRSDAAPSSSAEEARNRMIERNRALAK